MLFLSICFVVLKIIIQIWSSRGGLHNPLKNFSTHFLSWLCYILYGEAVELFVNVIYTIEIFNLNISEKMTFALIMTTKGPI